MKCDFAATNETYWPAPATPLARLRNPWRPHASKVRGSHTARALWLVLARGALGARSQRPGKAAHQHERYEKRLGAASAPLLPAVSSELNQQLHAAATRLRAHARRPPLDAAAASTRQ
jgi:hypothetical protein